MYLGGLGKCVLAHTCFRVCMFLNTNIQKVKWKNYWQMKCTIYLFQMLQQRSLIRFDMKNLSIVSPHF